MHKLYKSGIEFVKDNGHILEKHAVETSFFTVNSETINEITKEEYIFKFYDGDKYLLILNKKPYNMLLFGDASLCKEAAITLVDYNLSFTGLLSEENLALEFSKHYIDIVGGRFNKTLSMDIMKLEELKYTPKSNIINCTRDNFTQIKDIIIKFRKEALNQDSDNYDFDSIIPSEFYAYFFDDKIVSIAKKAREQGNICSISLVYTLPEYRGEGFSKEVVSFICKEILAANKTPYLFVDKKNPISNHLYLSIGFEYLVPRYEYKYQETNIKKLMLAGGCFWCMSKPYYEYSGVKRIMSGYAGGKEINPTYEDVKNQKTGHRETILIEYDSSLISFEELIEIYFATIDPFDGSGQFIDKGFNYTCALFSDNEYEIKYVSDILKKLEEKYTKKTFVDILPSMIFYKAEEYHQDFAIKNPKKMEEELINSGRRK